jgi:hypothetical protein
MAQQVFVKFSSTKFHENPSRRSTVVAYVLTDGTALTGDKQGLQKHLNTKPGIMKIRVFFS